MIALSFYPWLTQVDDDFVCLPAPFVHVPAAFSCFSKREEEPFSSEAWWFGMERIIGLEILL
jgi:hypothetical protein